jgi:hypothetical protein
LRHDRDGRQTDDDEGQDTKGNTISLSLQFINTAILAEYELR